MPQILTTTDGDGGEDVLSETISGVIGDKALERIRPDLNIEKWSIWQPANSRNAPSVRVFEREVTLPDRSRLTAQVEIGFTQHGTITTKEQKVYWALVKCWEDEGCSCADETFVSRRGLAKLLKKKWGTNVIESIDESLWRLRYTPITWRNSYYDSATGETFEELEGFTILSKLKLFRRKKDGEVYHGVSCFQFHEHVLTNLSNNHTKPLLFNVAISFKRDIAQLLYPHVDLMMADKYKYERRTGGLCRDLGLKGKMYAYLSGRKRAFEPALKEMEGKPLSTGVLIKATLEKTKDGTDYKVVFVKRAYRKKKKKAQSDDTQLSEFAHALYERGIRPESKAVGLVRKNPAKLVEQWLAIYDLGLVQIGGLRNALEHCWQPSHEQLQAVGKATQQKDSKERNQKIAEREEVQKEIKGLRHKARQQLLEEIIKDNLKVIEEAAAKSDNWYVQERADEYDSMCEAYEQSPIFRSEIDRVIREEMYCKRFDEVERELNERLSTIDEQIEEMRS